LQLQGVQVGVERERERESERERFYCVFGAICLLVGFVGCCPSRGLDGKDKKFWGGGSGRNPLHFFLFSSGRSKTVFWVFYTFFLKKLGWNFFLGRWFCG